MPLYDHCPFRLPQQLVSLSWIPHSGALDFSTVEIKPSFATSSSAILHIPFWKWCQQHQWCRRRGSRRVQAHTQKFWFIENPCKIYKNIRQYLKIWRNYLKMRAEMVPNVVWFWKARAQRVENHMETFFPDAIPKSVHGMCGRKYSHKDLLENRKTFRVSLAKLG